MPTALIMAGGRSSRMRATHGPTHKALVNVLGVPMLERNIQTLLAQGFDDLTVAVSITEPEIADWVESRGRALAREVNAKIGVYLEMQPMGTIGAARALAGDDDVLVVNVDNLSAIDLIAFVRMHSVSNAAMTVAVHEQQLPIPFGVVGVEGDRLTGYFEKPQHTVLISSGTYVLSPLARRAIASGRPTNAPELVQKLISSGKTVRAYRHGAPWIDVNDAADITQAENLLTAQLEQFTGALRRR